MNFAGAGVKNVTCWQKTEFSSHFCRMNETSLAVPDRFEFLDFAKGYAILTIALFHALQRLSLHPVLGQAIVFGGTGVHLFFLLSGYGLGLSRRTLSPLAFYRRRLVKIWLPYVLVLTLSLCCALWWNLFPDRWPAWWAGVLLYQMFQEPFIESFGGHFWFISTILQFYLLFPALAWLQRRLPRARHFVLICCAVSVVWWLVVAALDKNGWRTWNSCCWQFLWEFGLGMALAQRREWLQNGSWARLLQPKSWPVWVLIGLFGAGLMLGMILSFGTLGKVFNDVPALLGYGAFCVALYHLSTLVLPQFRHLMAWIGGFSFSLYLLHVLVLDGLIRGLELCGLWFNLPWTGVFLGLAIATGALFEPLSRRLQAFVGA